MNRFATALAVLAVLAAPARAYFESGLVDTTFGDAGTAAIGVPGTQFFVHSMRADRVGRLLVLHTASTLPNGGPSVYTLVRLRHDGSFDTSFGQGGKVDVTRLGGLVSTEEFRAAFVTVDRQGRVLLVGRHMDHAARPVVETPLMLGRLNADGSTDITFGTRGVQSVTLPQPSGELTCQGYVVTTGIAERADGKLLLHGSRLFQNDFGFSEGRCMFLAQFHPDGRIDAAFGAAGVSETALSGRAFMGAGRLHDDGRFEATGRVGAGPFGPVAPTGYATWIADANGGTVSTKVTPFTPLEQELLFVPAFATHADLMLQSRDFTRANVFTLEVRDADGTLHPLIGSGRVLYGEVNGTYGHRFVGITPDGGIVAVAVASELAPNSTSVLQRHHLCVWRSSGSLERCGAIGPAAGGMSSTSYLAPDGSLYVANNTGVLLADGTRAGFVGRFNVTAPIIEYYNTGLKHYFMTYDGIEAQWIDRGGAGEGWTRTGQSFKSGGIAPACRFYGTPGIGPPSHFFTLNPAECEWVKLDPGWTFLTMAFHAHPEVQGKCASNLRPVHRYYNNRAVQRDSNHRYVKDRTVADGLLAQGWSYDGVVFCVRP